MRALWQTKKNHVHFWRCGGGDLAILKISSGLALYEIAKLQVLFFRDPLHPEEISSQIRVKTSPLMYKI